ncbi:hypothetical protein A9Z42_0033670 [Trichoderma parareesei]|uniref:Uncharacterized protein n=1 Tax=Trichoderma parareesei TaxID=858221 RepID=A0A2H2ZDD3_TRIPA|nr:hypothetical protein A9Z42_0033670 [Trichoderma parareesei]
MLSLPSPPSSSSSNPTRPSFNSHRTQDRLREGETPYVLFRTETSNLQRGRKSVFKETGLLDDIAITPDVNLDIVTSNAVAINVSDEDDSSASGVSLLQSPMTPRTSLTESESQPNQPLQDMPVQARSTLEESSWYVWMLVLTFPFSGSRC